MHRSSGDDWSSEIDALASLCARVDCAADPAVDQSALATLRRRWFPHLASGGAPELSARFASTYARVWQALGDRESDQRSERDGAPLDVVDRTAEVAVVGNAAPLPFNAPPRTVASNDSTLEVPCVPNQAAVLPFPTSGLNVPKRRLEYFDRLTGKALPAPLWVDEPTPNS